MKFFPRFLSFSAVLTLTAAIVAGCQQQKPSLMFLTENSGSEEGAGFVVHYDGRYYTRLPMLRLDHFEKFRSFVNPDGSYGVVLYVKKEYRTRLYTATSTNVGRYMLPVFNGLAFKRMKITEPVLDGQLVIWEGLNGYDLKQLGEVLTPVDKEIEEKRYSDKNPRPLPKKPEGFQQQRDRHGRAIPNLTPVQS